MPDFRTANFVALAKVETTSGTDASPVPGTDAVALLGKPEFSEGPASLPSQESTGGLDTGAPTPGGGGRGYRARVALAGSGTGGTAPDWAPYMRGGGCAQTDRASDETGTAQAGAAGTITLAAGVTGINVGDLIETTGGTGPNQTRVITAWNNTTKVASVYPDWTTQPDVTTTYAVRASNLFVPASEALATLSVYDYARNNASGANAILEKILGFSCDLGLEIAVGGRPELTVAGQGRFVEPSDVSDPGDPTLQTTLAPPFMGANFVLGGAETKVGTFSLGLNSQVALDPDPGDTYGVDVADIRGRAIGGSMNPPKRLRSSFNSWSKFRLGTEHKLWVRWGTALGNSFSLYLPRVIITGVQDEDLSGGLRDSLTWRALGLDSAFYLNAY